MICTYPMVGEITWDIYFFFFFSKTRNLQNLEEKPSALRGCFTVLGVVRVWITTGFKRVPCAFPKTKIQRKIIHAVSLTWVGIAKV